MIVVIVLSIPRVAGDLKDLHLRLEHGHAIRGEQTHRWLAALFGPHAPKNADAQDDVHVPMSICVYMCVYAYICRQV
jgi:hypothetical protein